MKEVPQPPPLPYAQPLDLGRLNAEEAHVRLAPDEAARSAIAAWLGVMALDAFTAEVTLSRAGSLYRYEAQFAADLTQACVVSLEPVPAHLEGRFQRDFQVPPKQTRKRKERDAIDLDLAGAEETPETLESGILNLAAPLLEELSLALDPYPRAPGAAFADAGEAEHAAPNPFAVLEKLKNPGG